MDAKQHRNRIHTAANRASAAMSQRHANCYADMPEGKEFAKAMAEALIDGMPPEQALEFTHNAVGGNSDVVDRLMTELEPLMKAHVEAHSLSLPNGRLVHTESYEAKRHEAMGHTQRALSATQDALTEPSAPEKHDEAARAHEKARDAHHEAKEKAPAPEARDHEELRAKHEEMCRYHEARAKGEVAKAETTPDQEVMKAQVKEHERHLKSGKIVRVGAHDRRSPASQKAHEASRKAHEFSTKAESKADHLRAVTHHGTAQGLHQTAAIKTDHPEERDAHMAHAAEHYDMQRGHASMAMAGGGKDKHLEERAEKNLKQHFHHEETDSDGDHDGDKPLDEGTATDGTNAPEAHQEDPKPDEPKVLPDPEKKDREYRETMARGATAMAEHATKASNERTGPFGETQHMKLAGEARAHFNARDLHHKAANEHDELARDTDDGNATAHHSAMSREHRHKEEAHHEAATERVRSLEEHAHHNTSLADDKTRRAKSHTEHQEAANSHMRAGDTHSALHLANFGPNYQGESVHRNLARRHYAIQDAHLHFAKSGKTLANAMSEAAHQASSRVHGAHEEDRKRLHGEAAEVHRMAHNFHSHMDRNSRAAEAHRVMAEYHERESR